MNLLAWKTHFLNLGFNLKSAEMMALKARQTEVKIEEVEEEELPVYHSHHANRPE